MSIPYMLGGMTAAFVIGYAASVVLDHLIVKRLIGDRVVAIIVSCFLGYVVTVTISAFGHSWWRWPPTLKGVPLLTLAAGVALSGLARVAARGRQPE